MANKKITELAENTTPLTTDIVPHVDDPAGTPQTQKVTINNILKLIPTGLSTNTAPVTSDKMWIIDDPGGTPSKEEITLENFFKVIKEFTADASPSSSDIIPVIVDPAGTPAVRKVTIANLGTGGGVTGMTGLTDGTSIAWDLDYGNGSLTMGSLAGTRMLANPTNGLAGHHYNLIVTQGTVGQTLTYDTSYRFPHGAKPGLSTSATAVDVVEFFFDGTYMYATDVKRNLRDTFDPETGVSSATLLAWFDANEITGLSDGDSITAWSDITQLGTDHSMTIAGASCTYETDMINGYPCVHFNVGGATFAPGPWNLGEGACFVIVHAPTNANAADSVRLINSSNNWLYHARTHSRSHDLHRDPSSGWQGAYTTVAQYEWLITGFVDADSTNGKMRMNGVELDSSFSSLNGIGNVFIGNYTGVGNAQNATSYLAELLIYDQGLSADDWASVESYLNGKYNIY